MRAIRIHDHGGPETLRIDELPMPTPGDDEALVRVHAAGLDPIDAKLRSGSRSAEGPMPLALGQEVSGTIELCGPTFHGPPLGAAVYGFLPQGRGGAADYVLIRSGEVSPKPRTLDHLAAAALPLAGTTAMQALVSHGALGPGQTVLIVGGAGGVGHLAIQIAKALRADVVATGRGAPDTALLRILGADRTIDVGEEAADNAVREVDLVLDCVGGEEGRRALRCVRRGGVFVSTVDEPDAGVAAAAEVRALRMSARPDPAILAHLTALVEEGRLRPAIERVFPLGQVVEAHRWLETEHRQGKVVLAVEAQGEGQSATPGERREISKLPPVLDLTRSLA